MSSMQKKAIEGMAPAHCRAIRKAFLRMRSRSRAVKLCVLEGVMSLGKDQEKTELQRGNVKM